MEYLLTLCGFLAVLALCAYVEQRCRRDETIADAQTTSEKGLW